LPRHAPEPVLPSYDESARPDHLRCSGETSGGPCDCECHAPPPAGTPASADRAARAAHALAFAGDVDPGARDNADAVAALVADLYHLAARDGIALADLAYRAWQRYAIAVAQATRGRPTTA
jgi:hypothetical protein